jgi:hypothetical protein
MEKQLVPKPKFKRNQRVCAERLHENRTFIRDFGTIGEIAIIIEGDRRILYKLWPSGTWVDEHHIIGTWSATDEFKSSEGQLQGAE